MSKIYIIHNNHYLIEDIRKNNKTDATFIRVNFSYNNNIILKVLRKFYIKLKFPFKDIFLNKKELQKYDIKKEDIVIFFDTLADQYLDFSKKIKGKKKLWIWNTTNKKKIIKLKKYFDEIYTFDKKDSLKYNLKYLEQFYWKKQESEKKKKIDLFFIGQDKGRIEFLYNLDYNIKLNNFIYVIRDKFRIYDKKYDKYLKRNFLTYENVINKILESVCIVEINKKGQIGLTLRALEALFLKKKLITNNKDIMNYKFYNENNIFIIDFENLTDMTINEIKNFLKTEYTIIEEKILKDYTFEHWLQEIIKG